MQSIGACLRSKDERDNSYERFKDSPNRSLLWSHNLITVIKVYYKSQRLVAILLAILAKYRKFR